MFNTKMNNRLEYICRLCLKVTEKEFDIDDIVKQMFDILLIKLDLGITRNPIICLDCMEVGKKCLGFKYTCINTEKIILSSCAGRIKLKHNAKVIYKERNRILKVSSNIIHILCRICMTRLERNNSLSFDALINESTFEMLPKYMVEMEFNTIENPLICANCKGNLDVYFKFVLNCVNTEEKIKAYCLEKGIDRTDEVRLGNVLQFMLTDISEYPNNCSQTWKIKQDYMEIAYSEEFSGFINRGELNIKDEGMIFYKNSYRNATEFKLDKLPTCGDETKGTQNSRNVIQTNTQDLCNISVNKGNFPMFKCSLCAYKSKYKNNFKTHSLVHKDTSEINMFKCALCAYEAKQKSHVESHMLVHKDVSEIKMFKCELCTFESKYKGSLKYHMLRHKDVSEIKIFKCSLCDFKSIHKGSLKAHMILHKDVSEINMFKCELCSYESKLKHNLKSHMLVHKKVSEIEMHKCSLRAYECKGNDNLRRHMSIIHKDTFQK